MKCKRILAALLAGAALVTMAFSLTACGKPASSPSASSTPKDYTQILHDARPEEDNEYEIDLLERRRRQVHCPVRLQRVLRSRPAER